MAGSQSDLPWVIMYSSYKYFLFDKLWQKDSYFYDIVLLRKYVVIFAFGRIEKFYQQIVYLNGVLWTEYKFNMQNKIGVRAVYNGTSENSCFFYAHFRKWNIGLFDVVDLLE